MSGLSTYNVKINTERRKHWPPTTGARLHWPPTTGARLNWPDPQLGARLYPFFIYHISWRNGQESRE